MLFLNTSGFEVVQHEDTSFTIYLNHVNNKKLHESIKVATSIQDPKDFTAIDMLIKTKNINNFIEFIAFMVNDDIIVYTVRKEGDEYILFENKYIENVDSYFITNQKTIIEFRRNAITKNSFTLEDLYGPTFKDVKLYISGNGDLLVSKITGIFPVNRSIYELMENPKLMTLDEYRLEFINAVNNNVQYFTIDYIGLLSEIVKILHIGKLSLSTTYCKFNHYGIEEITLYLDSINIKTK